MVEIAKTDEQSVQNQLVRQIGQLIVEARRQVAVQVNSQLLITYWHIGQLIVEYEQKSNVRAEYGKQTLREVSRQLTRDFGKGFSVSNLQFMRRFYEKYQIQQTLSVKLSWSHYCELLSISDDQRRSFYEKECERSGWSLRELKRQIDSSLFERLLLSNGNANKERVLSSAPIRIALGPSICWEGFPIPYLHQNM